MYKLVLFLCCLLQAVGLHAEVASVSTSSLSSKQSKANLFDFKYDKKDLKDILNSFAEKRGVNIIYSEADPLASQVTFDAGRKVTLKTAWELVMMLLDKAGFSLLPRGKDLYVLVANSALSTEQLPLYVNVNFNSLPDSEEKIRYIFYFENVQLSSQKASIESILKTIFPTKTYSKNVIYDSSNNGIVFTSNSALIKSAMTILDAFDEPGFKEQIELFNLKYAGASDVVTILNSLLQNETTPKRGYISKKSSTKQATYFETGTKVLNLDPKNIRKVNTLILFGKEHEVKKIVKFIKKYLDIPQDDGSVFYHVVPIQHIDASTLATQLQSLVTSGTSLASQSTGSLNSDLAFDSKTKILAESISTGSSQNSKNQVQRGGNRLIIAANKRDWARLEKLIEELDVPQAQVIVEALILDLDIDFTRQLSSQIRTRGLAPSIFPKYMQAQAGMLAASQVNSSAGDYNTLLGNLNQLLGLGGASIPDFATETVAGINSSLGIGSPTPTSAFQNATVFMLDAGNNANGVWAFFQLLSQHSSVKVVTRPFIVAKNNQTATVGSTESKMLASSVTAGVSATVKYTTVKSPVEISFTPLISNNNVVNLQNSISVTYWNTAGATPESANQQFTRTLTNNVSLKSGDVLILGGLTRSKVNKIKSDVPFLSKIPLVGNLFSGRSQTSSKDQLFILMRPTIIAPRTQGGMGSITRSAIRLAENEMAHSEAAFSNLKDPVHRWFFGEGASGPDRFIESMEELTAEGDLNKDHDSTYAQKIVQIGKQNKDKKTKVKKQLKNKEQQAQQVSVNQLQYQLHGASNPYTSKSKKKIRRKKKRRKKASA